MTIFMMGIYVNHLRCLRTVHSVPKVLTAPLQAPLMAGICDIEQTIWHRERPV